MKYTVKRVADLAGVSIRTLHHYDEIGLLNPSFISEAGYRNYSESDLEKLQQILFFKELEFSLSEIKDILASPDFNRKEALISHKCFLIKKRQRLEELIITIDKTINTIDGGKEMSKKEMFNAFDEAQMEKYRKEAKAKWPKAYAESEKKMANYTKEDYGKIKMEQEEHRNKVAALLEIKQPSDPEVQKLMEENFNYINEKFYTCTPEIFRNLGQMYVDDDRFRLYYDNVKPGLAAFFRDAMKIYADSIS